MKKILLFVSALAGLFLASCQKEQLEPVAGNGQVTFTIEAPAAIQTKAIADGLNVDQLIYEVWITGETANQDNLANAVRLYQATTDMVQDGNRMKANITLDLVNDQNFTVLFWAQKKGIGVYNTEWLNAVTYTNLNAKAYAANDNRLDAFYSKAFVSDGATSTPTVTLRRPFAQVNLCTLNNKEAAQTAGDYNIALSQSKMRLDAVPTVFNVATSAATNYVAMEFAYHDVPSGDDQMITVNGKEYYYAGMNYVFAGANIALTYDIATKLNGSVDANVNNTIANVPLKENHRTNIVGNLLTSKVDYKIIVDAAFYEPAEYVYVWDGSEITAPEQVDENIYEISQASELAWLAAAVNGTLPETRAAIAPQDFAGKTFVLTENIDLGGQEWTPIGSADKIFKGTFDGQNHTVKNLVVTGGSESNKGLFGVTHDGEIKNLTVENAKVSGRLNVGVVAGQPYTSKYTNITVTGHVEVNGMAYVGGVGGKNAYADWTNVKVEVDDETSYVKANSVENGTAYRTYVGGVCGFNGEGGHTFKNITSNINVKGSTCDVGGLFGIAHYGNQFENCKCTGKVEIYAAEEAEEAQEIGGIAGVWHNETGYSVTMSGCEFTGTLETNIEGVAFYYNKLVGKPYGNGEGKLTIDGKQYVATAAQLQAAINAAEGETTFYLGYDIVGDVTVVQKAGVKITIEGEGHKFNGSIKVHSNSNYYADAALTIKNVNFETSAASINCIEALENGSQRYSQNITVENCKFTATGEAVNTSVAVQVKATRGVTVTGCIATNMHSLIQAQSCDTGDIKVLNCTVDGKNGVAFKQVKAATVEGTTITALEYGIRFDGNIDNYGIVVKNNTVTANQPFIVRKMTGKNNTITLEGTNTLTTEAEYQVVITNGSDDEEYVKPTGTYTLTGADSFKLFPAIPVAKIGNTEYTSIDEAIAAWTSGTTLTLIANVTLNDAITLKSTEHHILDLGTYTMTAAKGKDAISISNEGRSSASYALDIKADATNPGGITATSKAVVKTTGKSGVKDRPIIRFYNGIYNASNVISHSGSSGTNCPQFQFHGGVYNASLSANRALIQIYGGTFNGRFYISVDSSAYALISGGKFKYLDNLYGSALNSDKFTIGSSKGNFDRGVYVDDEGYFVVGGAVITEFGDMFAAKATNASKAGSYLPYSSAAANGLYYTNAAAAIAKHGEANVVLK